MGKRTESGKRVDAVVETLRVMCSAVLCVQNSCARKEAPHRMPGTLETLFLVVLSIFMNFPETLVS